MLFVHFQGKIKFLQCIWSIWLLCMNFYFDLVPPFFSLWKFAKFLMSFLKAHVSFPSNFASVFSVIKHNSSVLFSVKHYILWSKAAHLNANCFDIQVLRSKFFRSLMTILNWQVNSSWNFASFFIVTRHSSPVNFKLVHFLLWIKGSHQSPDYEIFECSAENLPNSSLHFWKHKPLFFKFCINLHQM